MNALEFLASVIASLAWPTAAVVLVVLLKTPVTQLLLSLDKLKYKDLELNFGRELKRVEEKAKAIDVKPNRPAIRELNKPKDADEILSEASRLAYEFPEPAVALAWSSVEQALGAAAKCVGIPHSPDRPLVAMKAGLALANHGAIDSATLDVLSRMRNLRNLAVHGGGGGPVSADEAVEFIALAGGIIEKLASLRGN